ncbi:ADP-ribosylation factor-like 8 isoform X2 [Xiphias gladius]|uniref:ADP-ribosylation factor-like 8 isoform X2 n=1 Tax=Xiphias gladius TaxID=8245 RepID=UPI001A9864D1|nr:ADP-ribosylation factor-like 8 isoform X2 [Xiphias gladius]
MGLIFAKLWSFFCNQEHKVIIVGLDNAGKTTILYQFLMNEVVHTSPTIGSNVEEIVVKNTHFLMWDIGGQESLRSSWNTYYSNTESTDGSRGRPSQRSPFHKGACLKSKAEVSLRSALEKGAGEEERESWRRQMCGTS